MNYSFDFEFFLNYQVFVCKKGSNYSFNSTLEKRTFLNKTCTYNTSHTFSDQELEIFCKQIHTKLNKDVEDKNVCQV